MLLRVWNGVRRGTGTVLTCVGPTGVATSTLSGGRGQGGAHRQHGSSRYSSEAVLMGGSWQPTAPPPPPLLLLWVFLFVCFFTTIIPFAPCASLSASIAASRLLSRGLNNSLIFQKRKLRQNSPVAAGRSHRVKGRKRSQEPSLRLSPLNYVVLLVF